MSFLQPLLLYGLPLALLPVLIHLIHLYRRRTIRWAAMMFLLAAQKMNKGFSRLRRWLILASRVLAVLALILAVSRPLAGGWLGLTGGAPDTILILLDRSASMEQQNPATGESKRLAGLRNLTKAIKDTVGNRSHLVLVDSAELKPVRLEKPDSLLDLPQVEGTDTTADVPALMQAALDFITTNKTGRTDVWLLSDLQVGDWDASSGRWDALRTAFSTLQGVRFRLLAYPELPKEDLGVTVEKVVRRETPEKAELLLDIRLVRTAAQPIVGSLEVPLRLVINGIASTFKAEMRDNQLLLQGHPVVIDKATKRGWGRVELPGDSFGPNNVYHFVFDEPPVLRSAIVSDDPTQTGPLSAALSVSADPAKHCQATVLPVARAAEVRWDDMALVVWQAPLPGPDDILGKQMQNFVASGRTLIFLPPETPKDQALFGLKWGAWTKAPQDKPLSPSWWRNDSDLLANTRDGAALPVGDLEVMRYCAIDGDGVPLARISGSMPLLERSTVERSGLVYFLGTLPGLSSSSLARDGVVMFALLHRALDEGAKGLGNAQQRYAARDALPGDLSKWHAVGRAQSAKGTESISAYLPLHAGVVESGVKMVALNRPPSEDQHTVIGMTTLDGLFRGLSYERVDGSLEGGKSLASEIWRTFLILMALALVLESLLCIPMRHEQPAQEPYGAVAPPTTA